MPATLENTTALSALNLEPLVWGEYNVRHYGARGGGVDDTAAIDRAVAAMNAAGGGTLAFPFGAFTTSGGHVISVPCKIKGHGTGYYHDDNAGSYHYLGIAPSVIRVTSGTAYAFTFTTPYAEVEGLTFQCIAATPTAGGAFLCSGSGTAKKACRFQFRNVAIIDGYYGIEHANGAYSTFHHVNFTGQRKYCLYVRNDADADWGDCVVSDCFFTHNGTHTTDAAIRYESGGGLKVRGCKFVAPNIIHAIHAVFGTGAISQQLYVIGNSMDGVGGNGVRVETAGLGQFNHVLISDNFIATYAEPIYFNNGGAAGSLLYLSVDHCHLTGTDVTKPLIRVGGNGGINVVLGVIIPSGSYSAIYAKGASDGVIGGFIDTGDGIFTSPSALGTSGPNAAFVARGRDGSVGFTLLSDTSSTFRIYDISRGANAIAFDNAGGATVLGKFRAPAVSLGGGAGTSAGVVGNIKLAVYDDGNPADTFGLGISNGLFEFQIPGGGYGFFVGGLFRFRIDGTGVGFNGHGPAAPPTLNAAATDLASAVALVNQLRSMAIGNGLAN